MKKRILIPLLLVLAFAVVYVISYEMENDNKESIPTEVQSTTIADLTLSEVTTSTDATHTEPLQVETTVTPTDTTHTEPLQEETSVNNSEILTISENELDFGEVSVAQIGGSIVHTFSNEELKIFVDTFNNFNIDEADFKKPSETHTASETPITVSLHFNNSITMVFMAFEDGETYFTDENGNDYALLNKYLSEYLLGLSKFLFVKP